MAESFDHQPADGSILVGLRKLEAETLVEFRYRRASHHRESARTDYSGELFAEVVFILDIADDLLDQIFEGQDSGGAAVFIDDHRQIFPGALHRKQSLVERHRFGKITDRAHHIAHRAAQIGRAQQIEDVYDADDVGDSALEN